MAITAAQLQTELGLNPNDAKVLQHQMPLVSTVQVWYVVGNQDATAGRARWITTTAADDAATQAAAVVTALNA